MQPEHQLNICQLLEGKQDCTYECCMAKQGGLAELKTETHLFKEHNEKIS